MTPRLLPGYTCGMMCFVSCSQPTTTQRSADARTTPLKNRIPTADPIKYRSVRDARGWQNPYLIVKATGIDMLPIGADKNAQTTSPVGVVGYLEKLPSAAWPYGLVWLSRRLASVTRATIIKSKEIEMNWFAFSAMPGSLSYCGPQVDRVNRTRLLLNETSVRTQLEFCVCRVLAMSSRLR
jgi:hypothetical protein